ncbi:uncharacterized protein UV8b_07719 [Ustilaginoidea virens]|uniref:Uncharacterized protein n=1 Tax=Ustilaginoidea virens TaxID=1159556 RepID=A0A8E5MKB6_USTVR|nr:uncharacterized protein UV8b_07719 [Ustilaginoidea virens]QUC23478.1 hypothetical protein UV8b_07719 [Ustilaginoidea virens]
MMQQTWDEYGRGALRALSFDLVLQEEGVGYVTSHPKFGRDLRAGIHHRTWESQAGKRKTRHLGHILAYRACQFVGNLVCPDDLLAGISRTPPSSKGVHAAQRQSPPPLSLMSTTRPRECHCNAQKSGISVGLVECRGGLSISARQRKETCNFCASRLSRCRWPSPESRMRRMGGCEALADKRVYCLSVLVAPKCSIFRPRRFLNRFDQPRYSLVGPKTGSDGFEKTGGVSIPTLPSHDGRKHPDGLPVPQAPKLMHSDSPSVRVQRRG